MNNAGMDGYHYVDEPETSAIPKLKMYQTLSTDGQGWRVWEINSTQNPKGSPVDTMLRYNPQGTTDRNDNVWVVVCTHFWTESQAREYMSAWRDDSFWDVENV